MKLIWTTINLNGINSVDYSCWGRYSLLLLLGILKSKLKFVGVDADGRNEVSCLRLTYIEIY